MSEITCTVVVPVYNEQEVLRESCRRLTETMEASGVRYELLFVNDGSADGSPGILRELCREDERIRALFFSRNFGHQNAVTAGIDAARGDCVVLIDADLQDPPELIPVMIDLWRQGKQVVYGKRAARKGETAFKKLTASVFYRVLDRISEVRIPTDTGDFRLMDRAVCDVLRAMPEHNRYVRGMVAWTGFEQAALEYVRQERAAGETKYTLKKMLRLAEDGIVSFSSKPLRFALFCGGALAGLAGTALLVLLILAACGVGGLGVWIAAAAVLLALGVTQAFLGVFGSYLARVCDEVRGRPNYIVAERIGFDRSEDGAQETGA